MTEKLQQFISRQAAILERAGIDQGRVEVEMILCHLLDVDRLNLYLEGSKRLDGTVLNRFDAIMKQRLTRHPLQFILGEAWFYGRKFYVSPAAMAPTPETERLCEAAINFARQAGNTCPRILDVGVGSGVIALTMAKELKDCRIVALDISLDAIEVARKNATDLGVSDRVEFRRSDFFSAVGENEKFDLILSNPPYIRDGEYDHLPPEVKADPKVAMVAGPDGLDAIRVILEKAPPHLAGGGRIMFEVGLGQAAEVTALTEKNDRYQSIVIVKDFNDIGRVVILSCD
ncbi:MAG: peptide chain release factor N(5)-glutamine methyltransferase [candidate division Zixibacteria bacterium]|nr:peptide chain release factor N(5)-glutamine methyltransferase [candidate division Zixibacteria bacterium]